MCQARIFVIMSFFFTHINTQEKWTHSLHSSITQLGVGQSIKKKRKGCVTQHNSALDQLEGFKWSAWNLLHSQKSEGVIITLTKWSSVFWNVFYSVGTPGPSHWQLRTNEDTKVCEHMVYLAILQDRHKRSSDSPRTPDTLLHAYRVWSRRGPSRFHSSLLHHTYTFISPPKQNNYKLCWTVTLTACYHVGVMNLEITQTKRT